MEGRGLESQEEGPFWPGPLPFQTGQDGEVCCPFPTVAFASLAEVGRLLSGSRPSVPAWPSVPATSAVPRTQVRSTALVPFSRTSRPWGPAPAAVEGAALLEGWASEVPHPMGTVVSPLRDSYGSTESARSTCSELCPGPPCSQLPLLSDQEGKGLTFVCGHL